MNCPRCHTGWMARGYGVDGIYFSCMHCGFEDSGLSPDQVLALLDEPRRVGHRTDLMQETQAERKRERDRIGSARRRTEADKHRDALSQAMVRARE